MRRFYIISVTRGLVGTADTQAEAEDKGLIAAVNTGRTVHIHDRLTELTGGTHLAALTAERTEALAGALARVDAAAEGASNDEEIEALQDALGIACAMLADRGVTIPGNNDDERN